MATRICALLLAAIAVHASMRCFMSPDADREGLRDVLLGGNGVVVPAEPPLPAPEPEATVEPVEPAEPPRRAPAPAKPPRRAPKPEAPVEAAKPPLHAPGPVESPRPKPSAPSSPQPEAAPAAWGPFAVALVLGLMFGLLNPMRAVSRPYPVEPDGMQSFKQHVGSLRSEPELTDLERQDVNEKWLDTTKAELAKDMQVKVKATQPVQKTARMYKNIDTLRELAAKTQIPS